MRKLFCFILILVLFTACDNPKSLRHLFRAANKVNRIEKNKYSNPSNSSLLSYSQTTDSLGNISFNAYYKLPQDTRQFFLNTSYNMPEKLNFEDNADTCTVNAFFFKSIADTVNNNYAIKKIFTFKKNDNFFDIKEIKK